MSPITRSMTNANHLMANRANIVRRARTAARDFPRVKINHLFEARLRERLAGLSPRAISRRRAELLDGLTTNNYTQIADANNIIIDHLYKLTHSIRITNSARVFPRVKINYPVNSRLRDGAKELYARMIKTELKQRFEELRVKDEQETSQMRERLEASDEEHRRHVERSGSGLSPEMDSWIAEQQRRAREGEFARAAYRHNRHS